MRDIASPIDGFQSPFGPSRGFNPASLVGLFDFRPLPDGAVTSVDGGRSVANLTNGTLSISGGAAVFSAGGLSIVADKNGPRSGTSYALPAGSNGAPSGGFTCTGLDYVQAGTYAGSFVVGNDGRATEAIPGTQAPSLVFVSKADPTVKTWEFLSLPVTGSIQGVAFDSSDATIWYVDKSAKLLRRVDQSGVEQQTISTGTRAPNALCYVPALDQLIMSEDNDIRRYVYRCSDGVLVGTFIGISEIADHLHYCPANSKLYETYGPNGTDGLIAVYDLDVSGAYANHGNEAGGTFVGPLVSAQAIEGIWVDPATGDTWVSSDNGFHTGATPAINMLLKYQVGSEFRRNDFRLYSRQMAFGFRAALGAPPASSAERIFGAWGAAATAISASFAMYHTTTLDRITLTSANVYGDKVAIEWQGVVLSADASYMFKIDLDANTATVSVNGGAPIAATYVVGAGNVTAMSDYTGAFCFGNLVFGMEKNLAVSRYLSASVTAFGIAASTDASQVAPIADLIA